MAASASFWPKAEIRVPTPFRSFEAVRFSDLDRLIIFNEKGRQNATLFLLLDRSDYPAGLAVPVVPSSPEKFQLPSSFAGELTQHCAGTERSGLLKSV